MNYRNEAKNRSNNRSNPNKNVCAEEVCKFLGVNQEVKYLHNDDDLLRAIRKRFTARSRFSKLGKNPTLLQASKKSQDITNELTAQGHQVIGFMVGVKNHVLFLSGRGHVYVDTAQTSTRKKVDMFYVVYL